MVCGFQTGLLPVSIESQALQTPSAQCLSSSAGFAPLLLQLVHLLRQPQLLQVLAPRPPLLHDARAVAALVTGLAAEAVAGLLDALLNGTVGAADVLTELHEERHNFLSEIVVGTRI